jgi:hypothetical protein
MNVKPGDVAIILKGRWPNVGRLVYVEHDHPDVNYAYLGYGILKSWVVSSLGSKLDTTGGPNDRGHTPDMSLKRLDLTPEQARAMHQAKAQHDFDEAAKELAALMVERESELVTG